MSVDPQLHDFAAKGFTLLPGLLELAKVVELSRAINHDIGANPFMWQRFEGSMVNRNAILSIPGIHELVLHPRVLAPVDAIFEGHACFEEAVVLIHQPGAAEPQTDWHRDVPHNLDNRYRAEYVQLLVYLSNVTDDTHRFAIFPESCDEPIVPAPELVATRQPFELVGAPGSAILFNSSSRHGVRKAAAGRGRRSLHIYFGQAHRPCSSEHTIVPERILRALPPEQRRVFAKRNRLASLIFS
jgi:ectoine hydroxylase-related dioxygenase (phytanoyl-CoA dioxygenase family)